VLLFLPIIAGSVARIWRAFRPEVKQSV